MWPLRSASAPASRVVSYLAVMPDDDERSRDAGDVPSAGDGRGADVAVLGGATESGGVQILRMREGHVELGELRAAQEGKPILGESVRLHARDDRPGLYDVETVARGPLARKPAPEAPALPTRKGPAKVSSDAYRSGWDSIFSGGGAKPGGDLPN